MSFSSQSEKSCEKNISEYYEKLGNLEKISTIDTDLLDTITNQDIMKLHPLLSSYKMMDAGDETTTWDNYQYKVEPYYNNIDKSQSIYFYNKNEPYYELTNFFRSSIVIDNEEYPTVEHFYQSQKFPNNSEFQLRIKSMDRPSKAREIVYTPEFSNDFDNEWWSTVKDSVMLTGLRAKFGQNETLRKLLLDTKSKILIENSPCDNYWGCGSNHDGLNKLGKLLMQVRNEL